ncbi:MAG TPA: methylthioribulose 1-phosphate dehydratase [Thermoanaerobaculia bacterium]|nr:methylthioribulose 1-phosphate dehydratase [Thermoanaerobaculia bacterium]
MKTSETSAAAASPARRAGDPRRLLAAAARELYRRGWMSGTAGNLSLRLADGSYWITASGKSKGSLAGRDCLLLAPGGEVLERGRRGDRPSAESSLHDAVYRLFPQAGACYHVHTVAANLASRLGAASELPLPPIEMLKGLGVWEESPDVAVAVFANHARVPAIAAEVEARFGAAPPRLPGFLIRNHGLTAWGSGPQEALNHLELFDFVFQCMVAARAAGLT